MKKDMLLELFNAQAHFGHYKKYRTPQLKNHIYKSINKIDFIDLELTMEQITLAQSFLFRNNSKKILIVSNRDFVLDRDLNQVSIIKKWKPGYISNLRYGKLESIPDIVIIDKAAYQYNLVKESVKANVTIIGICDTNTPFSIYNKIDYPIVINDDNNMAIELLLNYLI